MAPQKKFFIFAQQHHLLLRKYFCALALVIGRVHIGKPQQIIGRNTIKHIATSMSCEGELFSCSQLRMVETVTRRCFARDACVS